MALPPRLGFFLLGSLFGLVLTLTLLPHYGSRSSSSPFLPDFVPDLEDRPASSPSQTGSPVTLEDVLGEVDGGVEDDGVEAGRVNEAEKESEGSLRGQVGQGLFGE